LARALAVNPKILLADEPTGNLDWKTSDSLMDLFEKITKKAKPYYGNSQSGNCQKI